MRRKDWKNRSVIERRFAAALNKLTAQVKTVVKRKRTLDAIIEALKAIADSPEWQQIAKSEALKMVYAVAAQNAQTWREAARKGSNAAEIHRLLKAEFAGNKVFAELVSNNAKLIRSLPNTIASEVTQYVAKQSIAGIRAEAMIQHIRELAPHISENKARLIARTETAKAQAAITQTRAERLGLQWYVWRTSEDQRVRSSHQHMEGVICNYASPPAPDALYPKTKVKNPQHYHPGNFPNCRCYAEPIVDADFLTFPMKAHINGRIQRVTRKQFDDLQ